MKQQVTNFGRFYSAFHRLKIHGEPEDVKKQIVSQYTSGRTDSLKEMTRKEYIAMCIALEGMNGTRDELRRRRSIALKLMQELEVDTTDWAQINDFCRHPRIAGKEFGKLDIEELMELATRLRAIKRKGWERKKDAAAPEPTTPTQRITYLINLASPGMTSYN
ncbi:MAG: hypothetical protein K2J82_07705 [Muribaculaceae bacterium]|nr:hypothetical protein [Muribaculaceae bacterium]